LIDIDKLPSTLTELEKQLRFAAVIALTRTAIDGQKAVREQQEKLFTLRNKWTQRGVRITPATKQKVESEVYLADWYIAQFEEGGSRKKPKGESFQIPAFIREVAGISEKKLIPKSKKVSVLSTKKFKGKRTFIAQMKKGKRGLFVKTDDQVNPIRLLYVLQDKDIPIKKKPFFFKAVDKAYLHNVEKHYDKAIIDAFKSMK